MIPSSLRTALLWMGSPSIWIYGRPNQGGYIQVADDAGVRVKSITALAGMTLNRASVTLRVSFP